MADTENPENSGDSDATEGETNEEEGGGSDEITDDNETPVIDPSEETGEDDSEETDPTETEVPGEADVSDDTEVVEDEEDTDEVSVNDSSVNALIPSDLTIKAVEPDDAEGAAAGATKDLASAKITYTNGCVSGGKMRKDADITFKLDPVAGKILGDVKFTTKGAAADAVESAAKNATKDGDTYTIPKSELMHDVTVDGKTEKINDVSVTIIVNTTDVQYTLKADNSSSTYKLYLPKTAENKTTADTTKEITAAGLADKISFADKSKDISFVVKKDSGNDKLRSVSVKAGDGEATALTSTSKTDEADGADPIYTFKPADLDGLAENTAQDITIVVEASEAATITISAPVSDPTGAVTFGAVTDEAKVYADGVAAAGNTAGSATEGQKVIFTAKADETKYAALKEGDVTATFTPEGGEAEPIAVTPIAETTKTEDNTEKKTPAHYMIDLSGKTTAGTLAITAKTTLDDTKDAVKTVDFSSVSENSVEVKKTSGTENLAGKTEKTDAVSSYGFSAAAKPGYEIYQVEAVYDKAYKGQGEDGADLATITGYKENLFVAGNVLVKDDKTYVAAKGNLDSLSVAFGGTDGSDIDAAEGHAGKTWTTKNVKINVYAKLTAVTDDKTVTFTADYDYDVVKGANVVDGEEDDEYIVKPGADFFTFTVDAVTEPLVTANNSEGASIVGVPEKTESGYQYQIAAGALDDTQTITIARDNFGIEVSYDMDNVKAEVYDVLEDLENPIDAVSSDYDEGTDTYTVDADKTYKFIIEPLEESDGKIAKVSYTVGDGEAQTVTAKGGSYVFSIDMTADTKVSVEMADAYELIVTEDGEAVAPDKSKVYNVGHASTVEAKLLDGKGQTMPLFNADVKDGSAVAATIARINNNVVTLEFDSSEYNKVLTVELTLNDKARTTQTFKVKTTAAAAEVSLAGVKNSKVELSVDTKAEYKLTVKTKNASADSLAVRVVPADDTKKADDVAIKAAQDAVSAAIVDGNLVITAKPAMTGAADAAKVIIVDESGLTKEQKDALNVDNALKGGAVTVSTKDATIVGKNPTVKLVSSTDKTIKVQLGVPKEVVNPIEGKIFYKVELTVPQNPTFPESVTDAQKAAITAALTAAANEWNTNHLYHEKAALDAKDGLLEIDVMQFTEANVAAGLDKGALLSGFSVKATLLQTIAAEGLPSAAATTIEGGSAALENIATKNPYYEVKLGLKKGTTSLITGQDKDVVVATPNFNKLTSYSSVTVEFVNTASGEVYGAAHYGLTAKYNELSNAVIVNAKNASYSYNASDYYKNLGVKVTAYAEDSAYGAVATQKLTVVNGIQAINASAPLEVYKADNKPATFTVTTNLNSVSSNKKYAPKSKKLDYQIVDADTESADDLRAELKANVTVKNGKVSINKNYIVAPKTAQNQFKVKVIAKDYADSTVVNCTGVITITDEGLQTGEVAVFDVSGGNGSAKLVAASTGSIQATERFNEFKVAVLAPGVKTTKKSYDLTTGSADIINPALVTFKSSNAKSVAVADNGNLSVLKAAKNVKITVTPKDGSKPKPVPTLTLKEVGQVSASPLLRISRYQTSALGKADELHEGGATTINYNGNSTNNYFKLEVVKAVTEGDATTYESFYLANYQITYKGAKQIGKTVNGVNGDSLTIVANAADAVITLKDKTNRSAAPVVYTLHNDDFVADKNAKAPKIATKTKLTQNTRSDYVYYTVTGGKTDDFTDKYVMLSIDQTKKNPADISGVFTDYEDNSYLDKPLPILMGAGFNLYINTQCDSGNYNLVATVGSLENGVFKPEYKDAKVTVKIAKAKAASLSATGNYTLALKAGSGQYIKYKSGNGWATFTNEADDNGNYAKNAIINGQENHFTDYFEVSVDYNGMYVALKDTLPLTAPDNDKDAPALDKIADDANKNDRIGYISIDNGSKFIDVKLTITIKDYTKDNTKYKVTATPVLDGPKAVTALTILEGKASVDVCAMMAVSEAGFTPIYDRYGNCYLEAANLTAGNHKVDLYIVPWNAPKAYRDAISTANGDAAKREAYEKYGIKTTITVKAADKTKTAGKAVLVNKGSNKWTVADTDYNAPTGWSKYTPFSFKNKLSVAETTDIAIKASVNGKEVDYVSFDLADKKYMSYETINGQNCINLPTSYPMQIKLDKTKLVAAIAADAANAEIAAKNKLDWGKTVNVKATFSYGTNGPKEDELTFQIKLPGAGAADAAVTEALNAAEKKLQSNIETYTKALTDANPDYVYDDDTVVGINYNVEAYIRNEINKAIKGAAVTVEVTNNGTTTSESDGETITTYDIASEWTVVVKTTATGNAELYNHKFVIPVKADTDTIVSAIEGLSLGSDDGTDTTIKDGDKVLLKVTADTTAAEFAAAVRAKLGVAATRNLSITARIVGKPVAPTTEDTGSITFKLTVKDLSKAPNEDGYVDSTNEIKYVLGQLDSLSTCVSNVTTGLDATALTAIVKDAWIAANNSDEAFYDEVKKQIKEKAAELIDNNPNVTVEGFVQKDSADDFTFTKPESAADNAKKISFKLHLKDAETVETDDNASDFVAEISNISISAIAEFQNAAELATAAGNVNEIEYAATEAEALAKIKEKVVALSKNPAYNAANSVTVAAGTEENSKTVFTAPGENDGSITNVIVTTGTGDTEKATLASVTVKKQATTPAPAPEG